MQVIIAVADIKKELELALNHSDVNYQKASSIYLNKLRSYVQYVEKQLRSEKKLTKPAPHLQAWHRGDLISYLDALKLHQGATIEIDNRELGDLTLGIQRLREVAEETISALGAISY